MPFNHGNPDLGISKYLTERGLLRGLKDKLVINIRILCKYECPLFARLNFQVITIEQ